MQTTSPPRARVPSPLRIAPPLAQVACSVCAFNPLCHPRSAPSGAPSPVEVRRRLSAGQALYRVGSPHASIYAVRAGFLKLSLEGDEGGTHIVRFLLPGDVLGLDGYATGLHQVDAVALGACEVCEIPAYRAEILSDFSPRIGAHLRRLLARELAQSHRHAAAIAGLDIRQRTGRFLVELGKRWLERGYSASTFMLPMSRRDIAGYLGLTPESLSRVLAGFQARGWIRLEGRSLEILQADALAGALPAGS